MNILITGGAGYVGSKLVPQLLAAGHQTRLLDCLIHGGEALLPVWAHSGFEFVRGDIRDQSLVNAVLDGIDAVVHLAAIVGDPACARDPELARSTNYEASRQLIHAARRRRIKRFVFSSTCSNYGKMANPDAWVDESSELRPVSLYAQTKVEVERILLDPSQTDGIDAPTALRCATVYGVSPRMRFDLTVNEFAMEMISKNHLVVFGEQFWRPYIHVFDMARAIKEVLEAPLDQVRNEVFNVGDDGQNFTKRMLVDMIRPFAPDANVEYVAKQEDPRDYRVKFGKIATRLGFSISRTVAQGISELAKLISDGVIVQLSHPRYRNVS